MGRLAAGVGPFPLPCVEAEEVMICAEVVTPAGLPSRLSGPLLELWEMILAGPVLVKLMAKGGLVDPGGALDKYKYYCRYTFVFCLIFSGPSVTRRSDI